MGLPADHSKPGSVKRAGFTICSAHVLSIYIDKTCVLVYNGEVGRQSRREAVMCAPGYNRFADATGEAAVWPDFTAAGKEIGYEEGKVESKGYDGAFFDGYLVGTGAVCGGTSDG